MEITFVTSNSGKAAEVAELLGKSGIDAKWVKLDVAEMRSDSLEEISMEKAKAAFDRINKPLIMEDTGIFFDAYRNFPGTYSKHVFSCIGYSGIMRLLSGSGRRAHFKTVVTLIEKGKHRQFIGICSGRISDTVSKDKDPMMPYDAVFVPEGGRRRFSEMSREEKARFSSRAKAFAAFAEFFR